MLRKERTIILLVLLIIPLTPFICYGMDTDLYVLSGVNVPPNVLIIIDNSASMDEVDQNVDEEYDYTKDYSIYGPYSRYEVYQKKKVMIGIFGIPIIQHLISHAHTLGIII